MKPLNFDFSAVSEIDWARLAAYIDGEGCIRVAGVKGAQDWSRRILYLEVTVANTDPRLGQWLKARFGGSIWTTHRNHAKWRPCFCWVVGSRHAAQVLERCLPYFIIKREQADLALAFQAATIRTSRKGQPRELDKDTRELQYALREELSALNGRGRLKISGATPKGVQ
jgi:hypothetical protein